MTDRALLEAAARAAGMRVWRGAGWQEHILFTETAPDPSGKVTGVEWNPLADDGDAARLEAARGISVLWMSYAVMATTEAPDGILERFDAHDGDRNKARRYASVRAAAAMVDGGE